MKNSCEENEITETWKAIRQMRQDKRASNRDQSAKLLEASGIPFISKNGGAHLIVCDSFNFWPGTGLWMRINTKAKSQRNYGVHNLIQHIKRNPQYMRTDGVA